MNKEEFERFKNLAEELNNYWRETFFIGRVISFEGKKQSATDVIKEILKCQNYEELEKKYMIHDDAFTKDFNDIVNDMEAIKMIQDAQRQDINEVEGDSISAFELPAEEVEIAREKENENIYLVPKKTVAEIDTSFLDRMSKKMSASKAISKRNSKEFATMEEKLEDVKNYLNDNGNNINDEEYKKKLEELEKAASSYMEHKVKDGTNSKAIGKIEAASSIREFVKERKAEIFRNKMIKDTNNLKDQCGDDIYEKKIMELNNTRDALYEAAKNKNLSDDVRKNIDEIFAGAHSLIDNFNFDYGAKYLEKENENNPAMLKSNIGKLITVEFIRNELLAAGGEITPLISVFLDEPMALVNTYKDTRACEGLLNGDNFNKFIKSNCTENVLDAYNRSVSISSSKWFSSSLSHNAYIIKNEREILASKNKEKAEAEKVSTANLLEEDRRNEIMGLGKAYASLADYALNNIAGENGKKMYNEYRKIADNHFKSLNPEKKKEVDKEKKVEKVVSKAEKEK